MSCKHPDFVNKKMPLEDLVKIYKGQQQTIEKELNFFKSIDFDEALKHAANALDEENKKFSHQRRLPKETSKEILNKLSALKNQIESSEDFEKLYDLFEKNLLPIKNVGDLFIYDTALRIGANRGYKPDELIVQCGAKEGAQKLGLEVKNKKIEKERIPEILLKNLEFYQIEIFLCIYRDYFNPEI